MTYFSSRKLFNVSILAVALAASGCATTNAEKGAMIGAVTGAVIGKSTSNHKNKRAVIGAAVGAIAGAAIGDYMDRQEAEMREQLSGSGVEVVREGDNLRLVMPSNITFATNQATITPQFHDTLNTIANVLNHYDKTYLSIEGHTDSSGSESYNQTLSERRARSVQQYLVNQSIMSDRLSVTGYGEMRPVASNETAAGKAKNRRVEVQIVPNQA
ncbi:OmpA family protein [Pseudoalteromonas sp.]|uniref:OmpA family protein n=1 Tax=Pseudoalteromonas sp. TaxID=53249 RepID=UPI003565AD29